MPSVTKYWSDILRPVLAAEKPPTIPQAVVVRADEVLLVRRDAPRLWELPGGKIHAGETPDQAVRREVEEETGVRIEIIELLGWYERTGFRAHRSPVFIGRPLQDIRGGAREDVVDVRYFPLARLPRGIFPWYRPILTNDITSPDRRPLQRRQHLGFATVVECTWLDVGGRLGMVG